MLSQEGWHPEDIKAEIRKRGCTIERLAKQNGLTRNALLRTLALPRANGEKIIADFLGVHPSVIWPSRYHADGRRKSPQPSTNYIYKPRFPDKLPAAGQAGTPSRDGTPR